MIDRRPDGDPAAAVARAVLYEGFLLYPYRDDADKNRVRWTFGALFPGDWVRSRDPSERSTAGTSCLVVSGSDAEAVARVVYLDWDGRQATEREVVVSGNHLAAPGALTVTPFDFGSTRGELRLATRPIDAGTWRIDVDVVNRGSCGDAEREQALCHALVSALVLLEVRGGSFASMIDPPEELAGSASDCRQRGLWPTLVGKPGSHDRLLAAPMILPDYPSVHARSAGDFFDGTEIDEMLALRVLTLTDAEKTRLRSTDPRAAELLERVKRLGPAELAALHGDRTVEGPRVGQRVRLRPARSADAMDLVLDGRTAVVESIETDFEGQIHVSVVVDDDPGRDLGLERYPGHRFFFGADEIEAL